MSDHMILCLLSLFDVQIFHPAFGTGMERMITMRKIHEGVVPDDWSQSNAELMDVLLRMLNRLPARRPTASEVVSKVSEG